MAFVTMQNAVAGQVALSAEYNNVVNNVYDLNTRTTTAQTTADGAASAASAAQSTANTANTTANGAVSVNTTQNGRLDTLELIKNTHGRWVSTVEQTVGSNGKIEFPTARSTASGITVSGNNTFTVTNAGRYNVSANIHFDTPTVPRTVWCWISPGNNYDVPRYALNIMPISSPTGWYAFSLAALDITLTAGASLSVYMWNSVSPNTTVVNPGGSNPGGTGPREATSFAIHRIG